MTSSERANIAYNNLSKHLKEDFVDAGIWARETLMKHEGGGHQFDLIPSGVNDGTISCSFAKPSWAGDHSGSYMPTAAEAICMAVCEYLNGC